MIKPVDAVRNIKTEDKGKETEKKKRKPVSSGSTFKMYFEDALDQLDRSCAK